MKYFKVFLVCFISMMILSGIDAKAQSCPDGWTQFTTVIEIIDGEDTCDYDIWYCMKCEFGPSPAHQITLSCWGPVNGDCLIDASKVVAQAEAAIITAENISSKCNGGNYPPCSPTSSGIEVTGRVPMCWMKYRNSEGDITHHGCMDEAICVTVYEICWDEIAEEYIMTVKTAATQSGSTSGCASTEPADPAMYNYSVCYKINTCP